jgi:PTS system mannose-specific IID component
MTTAKVQSGKITARILVRTFLRCHFVSAAFNTRGLQNVGLAMAMEPGLAAIYPLAEDRRAAWKRYVKVYNTHPLWTPFLVGVFLFLESRIARGEFPAAMIEEVKPTVMFTLSAVGDSFFGGSLSITWALATACLLVNQAQASAAALSIVLFTALCAFRLVTFVMGYRQGFGALNAIKRWDMINWGRRLKVLNAALLVILWSSLWPKNFDPLVLAGAFVVLTGAALAAKRSQFNREILVALGLAAGLFSLWIRL